MTDEQIYRMAKAIRERIEGRAPDWWQMSDPKDRLPLSDLHLSAGAIEDAFSPAASLERTYALARMGISDPR